MVIEMYALAALLIAALAMGGARRKRTSMKPGPKPDAHAEIRELIRAAARRNGVPERLALAIARAESGFNPRAAGDLKWWEDAARFERVVPKSNPFRTQRPLWHSYGLFQLLAPYHVVGPEDPRVLFDPGINADRGTAFLARLVKRYGDWDRVRLAYVGGLALSADKQREILDRWHRELESEA